MRQQEVMRTVGVPVMVLALTVCWSGIPLRAHEGTLDGKTFVGQVGKKGKRSGDKDQFVFTGGTFRSTACDAYGFGPAEYIATVNGDAITFEANAVSVKEGTMKWSGTIQGERVTGTTRWSKPGKKPAEYWFNGKLKN